MEPRSDLSPSEIAAAERLASGSELALKAFEHAWGASAITAYAWRLKKASSESFKFEQDPGMRAVATAQEPPKESRFSPQEAAINAELSQRAAVFREDLRELRELESAGRKIENYTRTTGDMRVAALAATEAAPTVQKLHEMMSRYGEKKTPMGIAMVIRQYVMSASAAGVSEAAIIARLVDEQDLLSQVIGMNASKPLPSLTGSKLPVLKTKACSPWAMVAKAADAVTPGYLSIPAIQREKCAPGVLACQSSNIKAQDDDSKSVVFMANGAEMEHWPGGFACLLRPQYVCAVEEELLPHGTPVATGKLVDSGTPDSQMFEVFSRTEGWSSKVPKQKCILLDSEPNWQYSRAGKIAILSRLLTGLRAVMSLKSDTQAEAHGAVHFGMMMQTNIKSHASEAYDEAPAHF